MTPENCSQPEPERPIDAIVYDAHPALLPEAEYIYRPQPAEEQHSFVVRPQDIYRSLPLFRLEPPAPAQYMVPQRFGMSAILGIMTALAFLFGGLRIMDAHPVVYLFFGIQAIVICLAQMFNSRMPRAASAIAGAVILPAFMVIAAVYTRDGGEAAGLICMAVPGVLVGAFLGYLTGTMAAGVFLVMAMAEQYWQGHHATAPASPTSTVSSTP